MLKAMRIARDDRRFIAVYVISMIAVTVRIVTVVFVVVGVVVRFTRGVVVMDVRMVSSTVAMIEGAHYIDLMRANRKWSLHTRKENHLSAAGSTRCPDRSGAEQVIDDTQLIGKE
jgi:hypothetical protein